MEGLELFNRDAEEAVVGALFLDKELVKECTITPNDLYLPNLRLIYSAIRSADGKGKPIDYITIIEELGLDNLRMVGGASYLASLVNSVPTTANFHFYEKLVREYAQKRKAIQMDRLEPLNLDFTNRLDYFSILKLANPGKCNYAKMNDLMKYETAANGRWCYVRNQAVERMNVSIGETDQKDHPVRIPPLTIYTKKEVSL